MNPNNDSLFSDEKIESIAKGPVTCLGKTFESDEARRAFYLEEDAKLLMW
ncbi:MAG: hypothetical protein KDK54_20570 [Leptospiraceae bacterium]|nr:hypothetical protein [Leptospiraceae bacterium]